MDVRIVGTRDKIFLREKKKKKTDDLFFNTITVLFWLPLKVVFVEWHPLW